jgi:hypothetical protein
MKKPCNKKLVKKVLGHLKEDSKDFKKGLKEDKELKRELKKK